MIESVGLPVGDLVDNEWNDEANAVLGSVQNPDVRSRAGCTE